MSDAAPERPEIVMYSSRLCPYCMMAKRLLSSKGVDFEIRSVDGDPDLRTEMIQRAARTSVPQIFVGEAHVGGCDELYALEHAGKLDSMLGSRVT